MGSSLWGWAAATAPELGSSRGLTWILASVHLDWPHPLWMAGCSVLGWWLLAKR
jgi:hypothetical protein